MSLITIRNTELTVRIATRGAELQSIVDKNGVERMWQGDPAFWTGRAPVLFPVAGGYKDDVYYMDGVRYEMSKHGFVRQLEWAVEKQTDDEAVFLMNATHPGFPFKYEMRVIYRLNENHLAVTYRVTNLDDKVFWYGMGAHEAYATPGGLEAYTLIFDEEETFANSELVGNLIRPETVILAEGTREFPLKTEYFAVDALVFRSMKSRGVTLVNSLNDRKIRVDYPDHDVIMFWQKPGAEYICIEPWINAPDLIDTDQQIEHKPGCIRLAPGESEDRCHTITVM